MEPRTPSSGGQRHSHKRPSPCRCPGGRRRPPLHGLFRLYLPTWESVRINCRSTEPLSLPAWQDLSMQFYRRNLPHMQRDYMPHFITFCSKFRRNLPEWARDLVLGCCIHDHGKRYRLEVAVVMPDHVHLILTPSIGETGRTITSLVEIMKAIKGASAHAINHHARHQSGRKSHSTSLFAPLKAWMQRSPTSWRTRCGKH